MAHFAELDQNNVVQRVIVVHNNELLNENNVEQEALGQAFCTQLLGGNWVQTSYNASFRKNYAGAGFTYDSTKNAFISPKPFNSWLLNDDTCQWEAPVAQPSDDKKYQWDEPSTSWVELVIPQ